MLSSLVKMTTVDGQPYDMPVSEFCSKKGGYALKAPSPDAVRRLGGRERRGEMPISGSSVDMFHSMEQDTKTVITTYLPAMPVSSGHAVFYGEKKPAEKRAVMAQEYE